MLFLKRLFYWAKTRTRLLFGLPTTVTQFSPIAKLPQDLVEKIISYFIYDIRNLLACSLTCRSWYTASVAHLHYSLTTDECVFTSLHQGKKYKWPRPLVKSYKLGLLPLVKQFRIRRKYHESRGSFTPKLLNRCNAHYFSALANLQELGIDYLDLPSFMPTLQQCFGHFSPTLRLLALAEPVGCCRQILYFIGLFPNLQDLKILYHAFKLVPECAVDATLIPLSVPPLQGRLTLVFFTRKCIVRRMIAFFGGLHFRHMDLFGVECLRLLLDECAVTLETLRVYPNDPHAKRHASHFNLSRNRSLRTLETTGESISHADHRVASKFFKTLLSSITPHATPEVVVIYRDRDFGAVSYCHDCKPDPTCIRHSYVPGCNPEAVRWQFWLLGEMRNLRDFRLMLCVDVYGCVLDSAVELLESFVRVEEAQWGFETICKPLIVCERRLIRGRLSDYTVGMTRDWIRSSAL